ncbi:hypothetical protein [Actinopolyspora halophila]|uniref:hypothetical protein n=1 Tax=Actinopolyspora halophila TaxID=1850 RepID=UPI000375D2D7|nr:hypothetical protein [Actinopolyspora halophila]
MSETSITTPAVMTYIQGAGADELDTLVEAIVKRRELLRDQAAAALQPGMQVQLGDLKPKYLNGLVGTVARFETSGRRRIAVVDLDQQSTSTLGKASPKYEFLATQNRTSHELEVPASCCTPMNSEHRG